MDGTLTRKMNSCYCERTSLRPYLDALSPSDRPGFLAAYSALLQPHYPRRADGSVLLPFRRLFLLLKKK